MRTDIFQLAFYHGILICRLLYDITPQYSIILRGLHNEYTNGMKLPDLTFIMPYCHLYSHTK